MSFRFSLPCHCDLLAPTTGTTSDCVHPNSLHLRSNQKVAIQQLDSEETLAARGDPSCMIGISETPGAFNRVGKKAASVGYSHVASRTGLPPLFCGCGWRFRGRRLLLSTRKGLLKRIKFAALSGNLVG
jgi:hypothetical protein